MNPLIPKVKINNSSQYFSELQKLSKSSEKDVNKRITAIFREHSDSLVADLVANPEHRKKYREIGANLRQNDNLQGFQSSIGYIQKLARLVEVNDVEGFEILNRQLSNDSTVLVNFSPALEKLFHLKLPENIEYVRESVEPSLKIPLLAAIIDRDKMPINELGLTKQELIEVAPHLTYLNCKDAFDDTWTEKDIYSLLESCKHLKTLQINSPLITSLPPLSCNDIDSSGCINLDPLNNVYQKIYESLGEEFIKRLRRGDLYLWGDEYLGEKNFSSEPEKLKSLNDFKGLVKMHLPLLQNFQSSDREKSKAENAKKSKFIAKEVIARKFLEFTNKNNQETVDNKTDSLKLSETQREAVLCEIIKIAVAKEPLHLLSNYNLMGLDQNKRFEILKIAVKSDESFVSVYINDCDLTEKQRFEIAKIADGKNFADYSLERCLSVYDVKDFTFVSELAKALAVKRINISKSMKVYPFTEEQRFEIAKIVAEKALTIEKDNFSIQDFDLNQLQRFEIAKILATNSLKISSVIKDFNLTQSQRFEIAKIGALKHPVHLSFNIQEFELSEDQSFEVAKIAAVTHRWAAITNLDNFGIQDTSKLFELMKIFAEKGLDVGSIINKHKFTNAQFYMVAVINAVNNVDFSKNIKNYDLTEEQRYEILKLAAFSFGGLISKYISLYEIQDQDKRFEIVKIATEKNPETISDNLHQFNFTKDQALQIIHLAVRQSLSSKNENLTSTRGLYGVKSILLHHHFPEINALFPALRLLKLTQSDLPNEALKEIAETCPYYPEFAYILEKINGFDDLKVRQPLIECFGACLLGCQIINPSKQNLEKIKPLIEELFDLRSPDLRMTLIDSLAKIIESENRVNNFESLFKLTEKKTETNKTFTALTCMLLSPYILEEDKEAVANAIMNRKVFQNSHERIPFLRNLERVVSEPTYSEDDKKSILHNLIFEKPITSASLIKNVGYVSCLLNFDKAEPLKKAPTMKGLDAIISSMFEEKLKLKSIDKMGEKFMSTFGSFKKPEILFQYAANLMTLQNVEQEKHMDSLREFVTSVLEGDFPSMRYTTENNLHLRTIFSQEGGEKLKSNWLKGAKYEDMFLEKDVHEKRENHFDALSFFQEKIGIENRLNDVDSNDFADLKAALTDNNKLPEIKEKLENLLKSNTADFHIKKIASFQLQVIGLAYPSSLLKSDEMEEKIKTLMKTLKGIYANKELPPFFQDLEGVVKVIKSPISRLASKFEGFSIIDTDDAERLLNIGEGIASCQSVTFQAAYSKCLLSYILDGKNRGMIVVDKDGKMIARAIIRLLWDPISDKAILYKEKTYGKILDPVILKSLDKACKKRADELGLTLLTSLNLSKMNNFRYHNPVHSLDGKAPSEYVDALPNNNITSKVWSHSNAYYAE